MSEQQPFISVVIPCRNEGKFIDRTIAAWLAQDYPSDRIEVLIVDGMSDDGTRDVVAAASRQHPRVKLLDNPGRIAPCAMNIGIRAAKGDYVVIISGHAIVEPDYATQCARVLAEHPEAHRAGGVMETVNTTYVGKVIAAAATSPVGVGGGSWRLAKKDGFYDDAAFGAWRRETYDRIGLYDESLVRNQDVDLIARFNQAGLKCWLSNSIRSRYYARTSWGKLARLHYFDGYWIIRNMVKLRPRRIIPLVFVLTLAALAVAGVLWSPAAWALAAVAGAYLLAVLAGAAALVPKWGLATAAAVPAAFVIMHFAYGLGSLHGVWSWVILGGRSAKKPQNYRLTR
jgi:glycosyltransferase involved in cell wall biosynthesis